MSSMLPAMLRQRKDSVASMSSAASSNSPITNGNGHSKGRAKSPGGYTNTTAASDIAWNGVLITRADLRQSISTYEDLVSAMKTYRGALSTLSHASASLARSLEACSRLKGVSDEAGVGLQAAAGLHHVIANHEQVLGRSIHQNCEQPLRQNLDIYKHKIAERSSAYERTLTERSRIIRQTEKENMATGRRKTRDMSSFRHALTLLQNQVDELDHLKAEYYESVLTHEEQVWDFVLDKVAHSVRSTLDVYDRVTSKSSDPHLEPLLLSVPDPFDAYGPQKSEEQIFSILPPLGMSLHLSSSRTSLPMPLSNPGTIKSSQPQLSVTTSHPHWLNATGPPPLSTPTATQPQPTPAKASAEITTNAVWSEPPTSSTSQWSNTTPTSTTAPPSPTVPTATGRLRTVLASNPSDCSDGDDTETETETDGGGGAGVTRRGTLRVRNRERRSSVVHSPPEESSGLLGLWGRKSNGSMKKGKAR